VPFTDPGGSLHVSAHASATWQLGVQEEAGSQASGVVHMVAWRWVPSASAAGVTVSPASGTMSVTDGRATTPVRVSSSAPGTFAVTIDLTQDGTSLPSVTLDVDVSG
jgi:hypothetical protein